MPTNNQEILNGLLDAIIEHYDLKNNCCIIEIGILEYCSGIPRKLLPAYLQKLEYRNLIKSEKTEDYYAIEIMDETLLEICNFSILKDNNTTDSFSTVYNQNNLIDNLLVSNGEKNIYHLLKEICSNKFNIMVKVRTVDVIKDRSKFNKEYIDFALKSHFDFLVCDLVLNPLVVIEFDGYHDEEQVKRDKIKDEICKILGLPIIRINGDESIESRTIATKLVMTLDKIDYTKLIQEMLNNLQNKY